MGMYGSSWLEEMDEELERDEQRLDTARRVTCACGEETPVVFGTERCDGCGRGLER